MRVCEQRSDGRSDWCVDLKSTYVAVVESTTLSNVVNIPARCSVEGLNWRACKRSLYSQTGLGVLVGLYTVITLVSGVAPKRVRAREERSDELRSVYGISASNVDTSYVAAANSTNVSNVNYTSLFATCFARHSTSTGTWSSPRRSR